MLRLLLLLLLHDILPCLLPSTNPLELSWNMCKRCGSCERSEHDTQHLPPRKTVVTLSLLDTRGEEATYKYPFSVAGEVCLISC
uniref:Putative secreted protein n=1 Tax=Anopheles triannulatus TaxID=58253 RepID=A0A2M4B899_9DIPT